jgi:hypothetical protein
MRVSTVRRRRDGGGDRSRGAAEVASGRVRRLAPVGRRARPPRASESERRDVRTALVFACGAGSGGDVRTRVSRQVDGRRWMPAAGRAPRRTSTCSRSVRPRADRPALVDAAAACLQKDNDEYERMIKCDGQTC